MSEDITKEILEGFWDCRSCESKKLRGSAEHCPNCGAGKEADVKYYLASDARVIRDEAELEEATAGPDWYCQYCEHSNPATKTVCDDCGASREADSPEHAVINYGHKAPSSDDTAGAEHGNLVSSAPKRKIWICTYCGSSQADEDSACSKCGATRRDHDQGSKRSKTPRRKLTKKEVTSALITIASLALLFSCCLWSFLATSDTPVKVLAHEWSRSIDIEHSKDVIESGWSVPSGGRTQSSERRQSGTRDVLDHYESRQVQESYQEQSGYDTSTETVSLGNGRFERRTRRTPRYVTKYRTVTKQVPVYRSEPVYSTWYTYEITRWYHNRTKTASAKDHQPHNPAYTLASRERALPVKAIYKVFLQSDDGENYSFTTTLKKFSALQKEQRYTGKVNFWGTLLDVDETAKVP